MESQPMNIRLRRDLHERLRRAAYENRISMNEIVHTALEEHLGNLELRGQHAPETTETTGETQ